MWLRCCPPILAKNAANQDLAVRLHCNCHRPASFAFGIERVCQAGRGIEPGEAVARLATDAGESAAHQNLAVRLHRDRIDNIVRVRVERIGQAGDRIEPGDGVAHLSADARETSRRPKSCHPPAPRWHRTYHRRIRVERRVQRAVRFNRAMLLRAAPKDAGKVTADENLAVRLHGGDKNIGHPRCRD